MRLSVLKEFFGVLVFMIMLTGRPQDALSAYDPPTLTASRTTCAYPDCSIDLTMSFYQNSPINAYIYDGSNMIAQWGLVNGRFPKVVTYTWTNPSPGTHTLSGRVSTDYLPAHDKMTNTVTITANVSAPSVSLSLSGNGSKYYNPATITLTATASQSGGSITKVEFYNGSTLLATTGSPYTYIWKKVTQGNYSITAKAYGRVQGADTTSSAVKSFSVYTLPGFLCFDTQCKSKL